MTVFCVGQDVHQERAHVRRITRCGADADRVLTFVVRGPHVTAFTLPLCFMHARLWRSAADLHGFEMLESRPVVQLIDERFSAASPAAVSGPPAEPPAAGDSRV